MAMDMEEDFVHKVLWFHSILDFIEDDDKYLVVGLMVTGSNGDGGLKKKMNDCPKAFSSYWDGQKLCNTKLVNTD